MAKKFNFRLEPVLKLRQHTTSLAKDSLNQVFIVRLEKEKSIRDMIFYREGVATAGVGKITAASAQANIHHRTYLSQELVKLEAERVKLIEIENIRREKLSKAMIDEKIIDKLKEKKHEQYKEDTLKEEVKFLDEIAIRRFKSDEEITRGA